MRKLILTSVIAAVASPSFAAPVVGAANSADIAGARNHVLAALADMKAGRKVAVADTRSYGCSVKYAD